MYTVHQFDRETYFMDRFNHMCEKRFVSNGKEWNGKVVGNQNQEMLGLKHFY